MEQPSFTFTTPFSVNIVEDKGVERVFLEGLISTTDLDLVNDVVTLDCLKSMQRQILERSIKLDLEHEAFRGETSEEKEINKTKIPVGKITDATVVDLGENRFGLRVKSELNRFHKEFENVKGNIEEKYLDAYSIAFIPTKIAHVEKDGIMVRMLDDDRLLNVALTGNAVNTGALNEKIFMKAMDAVEEYKQEKLTDPEIEDQLIVKASPTERRTQARNAAISEGDKEEEDEDKKKKKKKKESKHNHLRDTKLNNRRLKMTEDQLEKTSVKDGEEVVAETEAPVAEVAEAPVEEAKPEVVAEDKALELKAVNGRLEEVEKGIAEIKELLKTPVHKSISETKAPAEEKAVEPLDAI